MPLSVVASGVARFKCIGADCEFTCCAGWTVVVDPEHRNGLEAMMGRSRADREEFKAKVTEDPARGVFSMKLKDDGACSFLAADKLCSLQQRFGPDALPHTCAVYPRVPQQVGDQRELWGSMSCPEMARLCLLTEDGMTPIGGEPDDQRGITLRRQPADPSPYARALNFVRAEATRLLSLRQYPIASRLFFLAYVGHRTQAFFHQKATSVPEAALLAEFQKLAAPGVCDALHANFQKLTVPSRVATRVVVGILRARGQSVLRPLIARVLANLGAQERVGPEGAAVLTADAAASWARYQENRQLWEKDFGSEIDLYLENDAKNHWLKTWYTESVHLLAHAQAYLCRAALVRFLWFGHPELRAAEGGTRDQRKAALEKAFIEVVSRVTRAIDHDPAFTAALRDALLADGMQDFAHTTILGRA